MSRFLCPSPKFFLGCSKIINQVLLLFFDGLHLSSIVVDCFSLKCVWWINDEERRIKDGWVLIVVPWTSWSEQIVDQFFRVTVPLIEKNVPWPLILFEKQVKRWKFYWSPNDHPLIKNHLPLSSNLSPTDLKKMKNCRTLCTICCDAT